MSLAISLQEAAHLLSVEDRTVRNWVHRVGIQTIPDLADGRRRLITDDDLKLLADRFRRQLAPAPLSTHNMTNSSSMAKPEPPPPPSNSPDAKDAADVRGAGSAAQAPDEELQRVLKALDQLTSEVSDMRAKVDLLVKTALAPGATSERAQPADDVSAETRPLRYMNELVSAGG